MCSRRNTSRNRWTGHRNCHAPGRRRMVLRPSRPERYTGRRSGYRQLQKNGLRTVASEGCLPQNISLCGFSVDHTFEQGLDLQAAMDVNANSQDGGVVLGPNQTGYSHIGTTLVGNGGPNARNPGGRLARTGASKRGWIHCLQLDNRSVDLSIKYIKKS